VFNKIGLEEGDIVHDVNGKPVGTAEEFIEALQTAPKKQQPMIKIERLRDNGEMHPIYIELH